MTRYTIDWKSDSMGRIVAFGREQPDGEYVRHAAAATALATEPTR